MKVVFIQQTMVGGMGRVIERLALGLKDRNWDVTVMCFRIEQGIEARLNGKGVTVTISALEHPSEVWRSARNVVRSDQDILLVCSGILLSCMVLAARQFSRSRRPICIRNDIDLWEWTGSITFWKRWVLRFMMRKLFRFSDLLVVVCNDLRPGTAKIAGIPMTRVRVIQNPAWDPEFEELADEPLQHPWIGRQPIVVSIGRLVEQKDFSTLVRAMPLVYAETGAKCIIVGDGPSRDRLIDLRGEVKAVGVVDFVGWDENPFRWVKRSNVFVLPSKFEGFGLVLVEAMGMGVPVVSSDCRVGPREILASGKYGALVPVGDIVAMASAIVSAITEPTDSSLLKERAQYYSTARAVDEYEKAFRTVGARM